LATTTEQELRAFSVFLTQQSTTALYVTQRRVIALYDAPYAVVVEVKDGGSLDMIDWYLFGKVC
jgi:hypothetical protein